MVGVGDTIIGIGRGAGPTTDTGAGRDVGIESGVNKASTERGD